MILNRINEDSDINLYTIGDFHIGHKCTDTSRIKKDINIIKNDPKARVILMGDILEMDTRQSIGAGPYDTDFPPQKQYEEAIELLKPIKNKIYGIHSCNHSQRLINFSSIDIDKMIAKELGVKYLGHSAFHKIRISKQNYIIYSTHGSSGAITQSAKLTAAMKHNIYVDADIYLTAHMHDLLYTTDIGLSVDTRSGTIKEKIRHYIVTGHYLKYNGGYAERKNYGVTRLGCARINLTKDIQSVKVSLI